ncbi:MAG TPA: hypothetical protein VFB81_01650 [Myxococcales bacterium]|nr:hypothetical protein [Myxococcales bacterium]
MRGRNQPTVEQLAASLFARVEEAQGYAFVGDGETAESPAAFYAVVRGRLAWARKQVRLLEDWLRRRGELGE